MANIIDFNEYRERKDPDYVVKYVIDKTGSRKHKKASNLNNIKYAALGTLLVIGEAICTIGIGQAFLNGTWNQDVFINKIAALGFFIVPGLFYVHKQEILDAFKNLCTKFKEHKRKISSEELEIFMEEMLELQERQYLESQGFTMFDDSHRRR